MDEDGLAIGITAVLAGTTVLFVVLGIAYQPLLLLFASIFAAATYFIWYHASGRLGERIKRTTASAAGARRQRRRSANAAGRGPGDFEGFGPGRRAATGSRGHENRARGSQRQSDRRRDDWRRVDRRRDPTEPTLAEAYRTLGLDADADADAVRAAYRERVKTAHPDADGGDEEQFKRVNRAYERLKE
ncbi:J domain-containing protein [Halobellus captivus]|uniref:J domain-containing protein n=1 Tax=Halobellus captivus TaxID=2592614 RepID=UPI00119F1843|nr:J domain-containing protein [Halobellus captivus]